MTPSAPLSGGAAGGKLAAARLRPLSRSSPAPGFSGRGAGAGAVAGASVPTPEASGGGPGRVAVDVAPIAITSGSLAVSGSAPNLGAKAIGTGELLICMEAWDLSCRSRDIRAESVDAGLRC
jgi:hypothetical protein